jgi:hypothetical protein
MMTLISGDAVLMSAGDAAVMEPMSGDVDEY